MKDKIRLWFKTHNTLVWLLRSYIVMVIAIVICLKIFRPQFYSDFTPLRIVLDLMTMPILAVIISIPFHALIDYLIEKYFSKNNVALSFLMYIVLAFVIAYFCCRPTVTDYQYYVNIYNDEKTNQCIVGYADVDSMETENGGYFYIEAIYIDDEQIYVDNYDEIPKIEFSSGNRYEVYDGENTYYVEFIRKKEN